MPGTAVSMNFSTDKAQSCLYIGDNTNQTIYILKRGDLSELGRVGRAGRQIGQFHLACTRSALDSKGNIYTAEVGYRETASRKIHCAMARPDAAAPAP